MTMEEPEALRDAFTQPVELEGSLGEIEIDTLNQIAQLLEEIKALTGNGFAQVNAKLERIAVAVETGQQPYRFSPEGTVYPQEAARPVQPVSTQDWQAGMPIQGVAPTQPAAALGNWVCPVHGQVKVVPAGISQRTQRPYSAFLACPIRDCQEKPPRS